MLSYLGLMLSKFEKDFGVRKERKEQGSHVKNMPFATCDFHQKSNKKRLNNNANTKISHSQAAEQKFCWRMNRRHFAKRNEDKSVTECCSDSKKNVQGTNQYKGRCLIIHPVKIDLKLKDVHRSFEARIRQLVPVLRKRKVAFRVGSC